MLWGSAWHDAAFGAPGASAAANHLSFVLEAPRRIITMERRVSVFSHASFFRKPAWFSELFAGTRCGRSAALARLPQLNLVLHMA